MPVGLVTCASGASTIESWLRQEALELLPQFKELLQTFSKKRLGQSDWVADSLGNSRSAMMRNHPR